MKSGDTVVVRIDGVTYRGTVKREFVSPFGVPSYGSNGRRASIRVHRERYSMSAIWRRSPVPSKRPQERG